MRITDRLLVQALCWLVGIFISLLGAAVKFLWCISMDMSEMKIDFKAYTSKSTEEIGTLSETTKDHESRIRALERTRH